MQLIVKQAELIHCNGLHMTKCQFETRQKICLFRVKFRMFIAYNGLVIYLNVVVKTRCHGDDPVKRWTSLLTQDSAVAEEELVKLAGEGGEEAA